MDIRMPRLSKRQKTLITQLGANTKQLLLVSVNPGRLGKMENHKLRDLDTFSGWRPSKIKKLCAVLKRSKDEDDESSEEEEDEQGSSEEEEEESSEEEEDEKVVVGKKKGRAKGEPLAAARAPMLPADMVLVDGEPMKVGSFTDTSLILKGGRVMVGERVWRCTSSNSQTFEEMVFAGVDKKGVVLLTKIGDSSPTKRVSFKYLLTRDDYNHKKAEKAAREAAPAGDGRVLRKRAREAPQSV